MTQRKETRQARYTEGYKYLTEEEMWFYTGIPVDMQCKRVRHYANGWMQVYDGFGTDGPSGPTFDDSHNMRGAIMHDAGYYLLRHGLDPKYKSVFDKKFRAMLIEDGCSIMRADLYYKGVKVFAAYAADPKHKKEVYVAPKIILGQVTN
jgi:hypothetical protein